MASRWFAPILVTIVIVAAYLPSLRNDFIWDDHEYLVHNKAVTEPGGILRIWTDYKATPQYYPLVFTSYWMEYRLWGLNPPGYHVTNLLLHIGGAVVLGGMLRKLNVPGAWLIAALFGLHPVNVESVAWITERKNVLSGLFYFLSAACYLRFAGLSQSTPTEARRWSAYAASVVFFLFALLSKTVTATLPAVLAVVIWWRWGRLRWRDLLPLVPMVLLGGLMSMVTIWMERHHVGASGQEWALTGADRVLLAGRAPWFYASKLVWPVALSFIYPRWSLDPRSVGQWAYSLLLVVVLVGLWAARRRIGRGPAAIAFCFVGTLFPALGFFDVFPFRYSFVADHFQYLASAFLITGLIAVLAQVSKAVPNQVRIAGSGVLLLALGLATRDQCRVYQNLGTLWRDTIKKNPGAWIAHSNLGDFLSGEEKYEEAIPCYVETIRLKSDAPHVYFNLGIAYERVGKLAEAEASYRQAIQLLPKYHEAQLNLGDILVRTRRAAEGIEIIRSVVVARPDLAVAHYDLGLAYAEIGRHQDARQAYAEAIRLKPDYWEAWVNDGSAAWAMGRNDEAANVFRELLRRQPNALQGLINLGSLLISQGKSEEGIVHLRRAVEVAPRDLDARLRLAKALLDSGKRDEAKRQIDELSRRWPGDARVEQLRSAMLARER